MDHRIWVAIIAGTFALVNLAVSAWLKRSSDRRASELEKEIGEERQERQQQYQVQIVRLQDELAQRREQQSRAYVARELMRTYHDPLLRSAVDLQSKLFNILKLHLLDKWYNKGTEAEKEYAIDNTLYVIAEYLGWVEIVRREVQFIDLGGDEENRTLVRLIDTISESFLGHLSPKPFRIFRGEQRAIGELMMTSEEGPNRRECIGYATFLECQEKQGFNRWFRTLREDIDELAKGEGDPGRLVILQNALIDLIGNLDPEGLKAPMDRRSKVPVGDISIP